MKFDQSWIFFSKLRESPFWECNHILFIGIVQLVNPGEFFFCLIIIDILICLCLGFDIFYVFLIFFTFFWYFLRFFSIFLPRAFWIGQFLIIFASFLGVPLHVSLRFALTSSSATEGRDQRIIFVLKKKDLLNKKHEIIFYYFIFFIKPKNQFK